MEIQQLLTIDEFADLCKVHKDTIRRAWYAGEIPEPIKIGRSIRWRREDTTAFINRELPEALAEKELS